MTKYYGKVFDGRWKVVDYSSKTQNYTLENIYNGNTITIKASSFASLLNQKSTVSSIMAFRLGVRHTKLAKKVQFRDKMCIENEITRL